MRRLGLPSWRSAVGLALSLDSVATWMLSCAAHRRGMERTAAALCLVSYGLDELSYVVLRRGERGSVEEP